MLARYLRYLQVFLPAVFAGVLLYLLDMSIEHFDDSRQMWVGWSGFFMLLLLFKFQLFKCPPWRFLFILLAGFLAIRYILWRSLDSLIYTGPLDFTAMALLFLAEMYAISIHFLGMFVNLWPMRNRPALLPDDKNQYPTVDVFIPTYNESEDIVRITALASTQLDYPKDKLNIYICDDGGTVNKRSHPELGMEAWERHYRLRRLAAELGVNYLTRETNRSAKAGNLNHALNHTKGELILVLDCDHVPTRDFLTRTVEYFLADPKLFLVQTPHFFINPTPVEKGLAGVGNPNGENDMFYKEIHRSLDFWNSSYFCGSAALLRRTCLEEVGGISGKTITEDAETAFLLHSRGYNSAYMDRPMICGLSPESYHDYVLQRRRWAQGMTQLLVMNNPLLAPGLSLHQRLCYFNSCFYWLFGFARFTYFVAPACFLILGLRVYHASLPQILSIVVPYILSTFIVMDFFYGRARQPFFSEIYESVEAMFLMPAVVSVFLNPHQPSFKVTPKGQKMDSDFLNPLAVIFFFIIVVNLVAMGMGVVKWFAFPILHDTLIVTGAWCSYNLYLALATLGAFWERKQIRHFHRVNVSEPVKVSIPRLGLEVEGEVTDLSLTGLAFRVQLPFPPASQERVMLEVGDSYGSTYHFEAKLQRIITRGDMYNCGSEFLLDDKKYAEAVAYMYGDSQRWLDMWLAKSRSHGTLRMLGHFIRMGAKGARLCTTMFWEMAQGYWQKHKGNRVIKIILRTARIA